MLGSPGRPGNAQNRLNPLPPSNGVEERQPCVAGPTESWTRSWTESRDREGSRRRFRRPRARARQGAGGGRRRRRGGLRARQRRHRAGARDARRSSRGCEVRRRCSHWPRSRPPTSRSSGRSCRSPGAWPTPSRTRAGCCSGRPGRRLSLESSKAFAKAFMARHGIPTARFEVCTDERQALDTVDGRRFGFPVVVKADGLAAGKGVTVAADRYAARAAVRDAMIARRFGAAGATLVVEECLSGPEVSYFVVSDGSRVLALPAAQDHKRVFDRDAGPNTGGMGAFGPSPLFDADIEARVMREIVTPTIDGLRAEGREYRGVLYVGLMLTGDGPRVIEFNVRFGDPEAQVVLPDGRERPRAGTRRGGARGPRRRPLAHRFRPARRCRDGLGRIPGIVQDRTADQRDRGRRGGAGGARGPRRHGDGGRPHRHQRRPGAHGRGARRELPGGHRAGLRRHRAHLVRGQPHAIGHRTQGAGRGSESQSGSLRRR